MNAELILAEIEKFKPDESIWRMVDEQLHDNFTKGQCPQGRVNRLIQIWSSLNDYVLGRHLGPKEFAFFTPM